MHYSCYQNSFLWHEKLLRLVLDNQVSQVLPIESNIQKSSLAELPKNSHKIPTIGRRTYQKVIIPNSNRIFYKVTSRSISLRIKSSCYGQVSRVLGQQQEQPRQQLTVLLTSPADEQSSWSSTRSKNDVSSVGAAGSVVATSSSRWIVTTEHEEEEPSERNSPTPLQRLLT